MEDETRWQVEVNDRYQATVTTIISLALAALLLPTFFFRDFVAIPDGKPLSDYLSRGVYVGWISLGLAVLLGLAYQHASAKWIKKAHGQQVALGANLEIILDLTYWGAGACLLFGIGLILNFMVRYQPPI